MNSIVSLLHAGKKLLSEQFVTISGGTLGFWLLITVIAISAFAAGKAFAHAMMHDTLKKTREDAIKRSRAVLGGQVGEQIAPFLPNFPCNPADAHFIGKPVDFIAFPGATAENDISEILLIEVKTGESTLSARERQIKAAVQKGRVRFVEYRLP